MAYPLAHSPFADHCCCYCYQGSGVIVHTALTPLGPWTTQAGPDVACIPTPAGGAGAIGSAAAPEKSPFRHEYGLRATVGEPGAEPTPGQGCQYVNASTTSALHSQQSFITRVESEEGAGSPPALACIQRRRYGSPAAPYLCPAATTGTQFLWAGDRWQQSWDGTKGHDPQCELTSGHGWRTGPGLGFCHRLLALVRPQIGCLSLSFPTGRSAPWDGSTISRLSLRQR